MKNKEIWIPVGGYENRYEVSNDGRVRSLNYNRTSEVKVMKAVKVRGYLKVNLWKDGKMKMHSVHRIVYEAFNGKIPTGLQINHLDENKLNNWIDNLEVCTPRVNTNYGTRNVRAAKANINNPLTSKPVHQIDIVSGKILNTYPSAHEAQRKTGIYNTNIVQCCKGNPRYSHAGGYKWQYAEK